MPGRQAHGRSLLPASGPKKERKPSVRSRANKALDAFAIAEQEVPRKRPKGVRIRDLEEAPERTQKRQHDDDDEDDEDEEGGAGGAEEPHKKKPRKGGDDEFDGFSGGSGDEEEWHVGVGSGDEDSEIDSDEAFGESDEEKFEGYGFRSGKLKKSKKGKEGEEEEEDDEDLESLGSDAIDLATALDQWSEDEDMAEDAGSGSDEEEEASSDNSSDSDDDEEDLEKLKALKSVISGFAGSDDDEEEDTGPKQKAKISLADLGLAGVKDVHIKKSLKLMNKEEKATKSGSSKKLAVPLAKRQQDRLDRSAAYEKTTETLDRWIDTVKHNRRAEHLVFPLAQNAHDAGLDNGELMPLTGKTAGTELEQTILAIMEESGLGPTAKAEKKSENTDVEGQEGPTMAEQIELARQRRKDRELHSREAVRAKRIKKIKSRAYRRIHRKELRHEEEANHQALAEAGELDSDDERDAQDRRRALERVGTRHRESKWAKLGKKAGRAVWDDDFRTGLTEMAQQKDELRRRVEGRAKGSDDGEDDEDMSGDSGGSDDEGDRRRLLKQLDQAAAYDNDEPRSGLMAMKFMKRGEAERKRENDDLVDEIRRELDSDAEGNEQEEIDIGRREYGMGKPATPAVNPFLPSSKSKDSAISNSVTPKSIGASQTLALPEREPSPAAPGAAGAWSQAVKSGPKSKKIPKGRDDELDLSNAAMLATKPSKTSKPKPATNGSTDVQTQEESEDEDTIHLPMAIRDQELIKRAFAGEDVVGDFEREKAEVEQEDEEKEIDNTLPGWGGWVGEGVSSRELKRHKGRFITKVEGVRQKDRKDFKMKGVIISERRIKKVCSPLILWASCQLRPGANVMTLCRMISISRRSCHSHSRVSSSMRDRYVFPSDRNGAPRKPSRTQQSRESS